MGNHAKNKRKIILPFHFTHRFFSINTPHFEHCSVVNIMCNASRLVTFTYFICTHQLLSCFTFMFEISTGIQFYFSGFFFIEKRADENGYACMIKMDWERLPLIKWVLKNDLNANICKHLLHNPIMLALTIISQQ